MSASVFFYCQLVKKMGIQLGYTTPSRSSELRVLGVTEFALIDLARMCKGSLILEIQEIG